MLKNKRLRHLLSDLGLKDHEQTIYAALLELGHGTITDICKKASLHRPTVYKWIPELKNKTLINSYLKGKQRCTTQSRQNTSVSSCFGNKKS